MEKFYAEEDITIFCWNFFSHSAENFREGNHSMCQKNSGMEKLLAEGGDITNFCWNFFFSQWRNNSWEDLFNVSEKTGHGKFLCRRKRYHYFLMEFFSSLCGKIS